MHFTLPFIAWYRQPPSAAAFSSYLLHLDRAGLKLRHPRRAVVTHLDGRGRRAAVTADGLGALLRAPTGNLDLWVGIDPLAVSWEALGDGRWVFELALQSVRFDARFNRRVIDQICRDFTAYRDVGLALVIDEVGGPDNLSPQDWDVLLLERHAPIARLPDVLAIPKVELDRILPESLTGRAIHDLDGDFVAIHTPGAWPALPRAEGDLPPSASPHRG